MAAAGAKVTSFDNSDEQLAKDELVAKRDSLDLRAVQGDMADLSAFMDETFDLIFQSVSNVFVEGVNPVWRECSRVLKPGGRLLAGFMNPMFFLFDHDEIEETGVFEAKYSLPFSEIRSLPEEKRKEIIERGETLEFGHTLEDQIGGQTEAGFVITGLYEDDWDDESTPLNRFGDLYVATLARKMRVD